MLHKIGVRLTLILLFISTITFGQFTSEHTGEHIDSVIAGEMATFSLTHPSSGQYGRITPSFIWLGDSAGQGSGGVSIAIGDMAGYGVSATGNGGIFIGDDAGRELDGGEFAMGIGNGAGSYVTSSNESFIHIGKNSGRYSLGSGIQIGHRAGQYDSSSAGAVMVGTFAGEENNGNNVMAFGNYAAWYNTGDNGVFIGDSAGALNTADNQFILKHGEVSPTPLIQGDFSDGNIQFPGMSSDSTTCITGELWFNSSTGAIHRKF